MFKFIAVICCLPLLCLGQNDKMDTICNSCFSVAKQVHLKCSKEDMTAAWGEPDSVYMFTGDMDGVIYEVELYKGNAFSFVTDQLFSFEINNSSKSVIIGNNTIHTGDRGNALEKIFPLSYKYRDKDSIRVKIKEDFYRYLIFTLGADGKISSVLIWQNL